MKVQVFRFVFKSFPVFESTLGISGKWESVDWQFCVKFADALLRLISDVLDISPEYFYLDTIYSYQGNTCHPYLICHVEPDGNLDQMSLKIVDLSIIAFSSKTLGRDISGMDENDSFIFLDRISPHVVSHATQFIKTNGGQRIPSSFHVHGPYNQKSIEGKFASKTKESPDGEDIVVLKGSIAFIDVPKRTFGISQSSGKKKRIIISFNERFSFDSLRAKLGEPDQISFLIKELKFKDTSTYELLEILEETSPDTELVSA